MITVDWFIFVAKKFFESLGKYEIYLYENFHLTCQIHCIAKI